MGAEVLLLVLLCSGNGWTQSSTGTDCSLREEHRADVMILLDGLNGDPDDFINRMSPTDFATVKTYIGLITLIPPLGPDIILVTTVKCGRDRDTEFDLNAFQSLSSVVGAELRRSQNPPIPGGSTENALNITRENIFPKNFRKRENVPTILILVTSRNSSGVDRDFRRYLWDHNVKLMVVGVTVTEDIHIKEKEPNDAEVATIKNFKKINSVADRNFLKDLSQSICHLIKEKLDQAYPEFLRFTNVRPRRAWASWHCPSRQVKRFVLSVSLDHSDFTFSTTTFLGQKCSAEILNLLPNTNYRISVTAEESSGQNKSETGLLSTPADRVRLSGGPWRCSGSVEVLMDRSWSNACESGFGRTEAAVVCEELDCGAVSELHQGAPITEGLTVDRSFSCDRAKSSLKDCENTEMRCSTAANLTCSDAALTFDLYNCAGYLSLRYKDKSRPVATSEAPDLDFGSALCEQMGCGSAVSLKYWRQDVGPSWWLKPECVKQRSGLTRCLDLDLDLDSDSDEDQVKGRLALMCSDFVPSIRTSVSSEGVSVSSNGASRLQSVLVKLGSNFSVSCSLDEPFLPVQFHLQSPTGKYTEPSVNHAAHFPFQAFSSAHIGNYTCAYCLNDTFSNHCVESTTFKVTPGAPHSHLLIKAAAIVVTLFLWAVGLHFYFKRCQGQKNPMPRRSRRRKPSAEDNMIQMVPLKKPSLPPRK